MSESILEEDKEDQMEETRRRKVTEGGKEDQMAGISSWRMM